MDLRIPCEAITRSSWWRAISTAPSHAPQFLVPPWARSPVVLVSPFFGEGSPSKKKATEQVGTLILTSLQEDLVGIGGMSISTWKFASNPPPDSL